MSKQIPQIAQSPLTKKWMVVTKYKWIDESKGQFEAKEKFDVTDQLKAIIQGELKDQEVKIQMFFNKQSDLAASITDYRAANGLMDLKNELMGILGGRE